MTTTTTTDQHQNTLIPKNSSTHSNDTATIAIETSTIAAAHSSKAISLTNTPTTNDGTCRRTNSAIHRYHPAMVNVTELRRAMDLVIDASAKGLHDQGTWITDTDCGTAGCLAGLYALACGCTPVYRSLLEEDVRDTVIIIPPGASDDCEMHVQDWVTKALGLSSDQATRLFSVNNTVHDLKEIIDDICG